LFLSKISNRIVQAALSSSKTAPNDSAESLGIKDRNDNAKIWKKGGDSPGSREKYPHEIEPLQGFT